MRRLLPLVLRPWTLPLIVLALIAPPVAAFALAGPQLGLAVGAVTAAAVVLLAARARFDEPIEVAPAPDSRYRLLVVAAAPLDDPATVEEISEIVAAGSRARRLGAGGPAGGDPQVLVVVPATPSRLDRWASDLATARAAARDRLAVSLGALAAARLDALGRVGDGDVVQALEDELRGFAADEVAIVRARGVEPAALEEVRRRLDRPVRALTPRRA